MTEGQYQEQQGLAGDAGNPGDDEVWTTGNGRRIRVGDMDEQHVRNTLRMILRNRRKRAAKLAELKALFERLRTELSYHRALDIEMAWPWDDDEDRKWGSD